MINCRYEVNMKRVLRIELSDELYKKYKMLCIKKDLSITRQTAHIIEGFIKIDEENEKMIMHLQKIN
jgi:hypothetical protein